jgi:hypothetical protein
MIAGVAAYTLQTYGMVGEGWTERGMGEVVSDDYFRVLGVRPASGRCFSAEEAVPAKRSCFDRVLIQGTLPDICHAAAMTRELNRRHIRIFDFTEFAQPQREAIRENAERLAAENGITIDFIRNIKALRKEDRVQKILAERGSRPGLVHIFSAMETCSSFKPWHDKRTGKTFLKPDTGRCLHYYFYFIDPVLGLCHMRVPTWAPYRLQFCLNGHNWLATRLARFHC